MRSIPHLKKAVGPIPYGLLRIDLLLPGVMSPLTAGCEAHEQIQELGGHLPVIFMTGYSADTVRRLFVPEVGIKEPGSVPVRTTGFASPH